MRWLRPLGGVAVAATVAAVAILGAQRFTTGGAPETLADATAPVTTSVIGLPDAADEPISYVVPPASNVVAPIPSARLTNYVVAHSEYSSSLGRRNVLSGIVAEDPKSLEEPDANAAPAPQAPVP